MHDRMTGLLVVIAVAAVATGVIFYSMRDTAAPRRIPAAGPRVGQGPAPSAAASETAPEPETSGEESQKRLLEFLEAQARAPELPQGRVVWLVPELRREAWEALALADPTAATTAVLQALKGDGDPQAWPDSRLEAAAIRLQAGERDGADTVAAWLATHPRPAGAPGVAAAAAAAAWMGREQANTVIQAMLSVPLEDYSEEDVVAILHAMTSLEIKPASDVLVKIIQAGEDDWGFTVLGAAAGALLRFGDQSGRQVMTLAAADDWFEGEELALGLGARGNSAVLPWLYELLRCDDEATRAQAAQALRTVGAKGAVDALRGALDDEDATVRGEAALSLLALGEDVASSRILDALTDSDSNTAIAAWRAVAMGPDPAAVPAARNLLARPLPAATEPSRGTILRQRVWAAALLLRATE